MVLWVKAFQMTFMYPWRRGIFWTPMLIIKTVSFEFFFHFVFAHFFSVFFTVECYGLKSRQELSSLAFQAKRRQAQKQRAARVTRNGTHARLARRRLLTLAFASWWLWIRAISNFIALIPFHRIYKMFSGFLCSRILKDSILILLVLQERKQKISVLCWRAT